MFGLERSYNFGVPWLMFWVHGVGTTAGSWCIVLTEVPRLTVARAQTTQWALRGRGRGVRASPVDAASHYPLRGLAPRSAVAFSMAIRGATARGEPSRIGGMAHRRPDSRDFVG
jgi:hypothetical protein